MVVPSLVVIVVMECSPFLFVSIRNPECSAVSGVKPAAGSAPAATIAVPPINNSRRVSLVIRTLLLLRHFSRSSNFPRLHLQANEHAEAVRFAAAWPLATARAVPKCPRTHYGLFAIYLSMNSQPY